MLQERKQAVADEVHHRLVSGEQEQQAHAHQLVIAEDLAAVLRLDQRG